MSGPEEMDLQQGYAVSAQRYHGVTLKSFHETAAQAQGALRRTVDADPLQVVPAQICYAANGNVRYWNTRSATT